jgi:hypothetical protein
MSLGRAQRPADKSSLSSAFFTVLCSPKPGQRVLDCAKMNRSGGEGSFERIRGVNTLYQGANITEYN